MRNKYDIFTKPQADNVKLLESQWLELQQIVSWIESWFAYGMRYMEQPPKIGKIALRSRHLHWIQIHILSSCVSNHGGS